MKGVRRVKSGFEYFRRSTALLTFSEARSLAGEIHGSLYLDVILRRARRIIQSRLKPVRVSLVQGRASEFSATLYTAGEEEDVSVIGPRVIPLEPSRLQDCLMKRSSMMLDLAGESDHDAPERRYLVGPGTRAILYLPLTCRGVFKGLLVLALPGPAPPGGGLDEYLEYLLEQLALAVENSDTFYKERRRVRQLNLVSEIARQAVTLDSVEEFLARTVALVRELFDYGSVEVWYVGGKQEQLILRCRAEKSPASEGSPVSPMVEECRRLDRTLVDNQIPRERAVGSGDGTASQLVVPIRMRGKFLGVLSLESGRLDAFTDEDANGMEGVASLIASTFDNLRRSDSAQQSNEYLQAILDSARDVAILSTDSHGYVVTSSAGSQLVFGISQQEILGRDLLALFSSVRLQREIALYMKSQIAAPLERSRVQQGEGKLEIFLDVALQRVYDVDKRPVGFLCMARDVTENVRLQRSMEALSMTDELTGLYNQRRFFTALEAELERSQRYSRRLSLLFFDLDGFKEFNDSRGHLRGDQVLQETGALVLSLVRANVDSCYRYGGDEFTVIMPETPITAAEALAERLRSELSMRFGGLITASIGIAESGGSVQARALVEQADRAMYAAKQRGGNAVSLATG